MAPHQPAVTFPGTEAESRHLRPARAPPKWVAPVCYRGNRGAPSLWAATVSPRHFQTALVPEPLAAAGRTSEDGGSRGRCASRRSGGEARPGRPHGRAGSRGLRGGPHPHPRGRRPGRCWEEVGEGGAGTVPPSVGSSVRAAEAGPGRAAVPPSRLSRGMTAWPPRPHALCGARLWCLCFKRVCIRGLDISVKVKGARFETTTRRGLVDSGSYPFRLFRFKGCRLEYRETLICTCPPSDTPPLPTPRGLYLLWPMVF